VDNGPPFAFQFARVEPLDRMSSTPHPDDAYWFAQEVQPHESALRAWLHVKFPDLPDTDDLVQESFARLIRARRTGKVDNARSYLFATARNAAFDLVRRSRIVAMVPLATAPASSVLEDRPGVAESVNSVQELEVLHEAIRALPPRCREIMTLQKIHGIPSAEIAARLEISVHTVNAQLVIGLMRCRAFLRERGILRGEGGGHE
jgi:RNA polymerase sigma factor (sigma-70 family)